MLSFKGKESTIAALLPSFILWVGNVSASSNRTSQTSWTWRDWMRNQCKGHWQKKLGFMQSVPQYTTLPNQKVEAKPLPAIFNPSLFLINPKLAKTSAFDSMTDEFAIVNVKRNGLLHLISPISHCEWDLGVFMEKSHGRCDEHYPVIMKGTLRYRQPLQTDRQGKRAGWEVLCAESCPFMSLCDLMSLSRDQTNEHIFIFTLCRCHDCLIYCRLHSQREMSRGNQVKCVICQWI